MIHVTTPEVFAAIIKKLKKIQILNLILHTPFQEQIWYSSKKISRKFGLPIVFTRTSNVYGPGQQLYRIIPKTIM